MPRKKHTAGDVLELGIGIGIGIGSERGVGIEMKTYWEGVELTTDNHEGCE